MRRQRRPRSKEPTTRVAKTSLRVAHLALLTAYTELLVLAVHFLHIDTSGLVQKCASYSLAIAAILFTIKLLDERPSASRRRKRAMAWSGVQALVRDGLRMISVSSARAGLVANGGAMLIYSTSSTAAGSPLTSPRSSPQKGVHELPDDAPASSASTSSPPRTAAASAATTTTPPSAPLPDADRTEELLGVLAAFPVALQHHLLGTRALPHPPLCDLLPAGYLLSLKRTEARVRFAAVHAGPSGSGSPHKPTIDAARLHASGASLPNATGVANGAANGSATTLNGNSVANGRAKPPSDDEDVCDDKNAIPATPSKKSNLHTPHPSNMPLSLLRLLEGYIMGFADLPPDRGGWTALQCHRALDVVKGLNVSLSEAEGVYSDPQPMITVRLCLNGFLFVLPLWLVCVLRGWLAVLATALVGAVAKFVLHAVLSEPEPTSSSHPLHQATLRMLHESFDTCPALARYYRGRLVARLGGDSYEVAELDRRIRRRDEWLPTFSS